MTRARNALPSGFCGPARHRLGLHLAHAVADAVDVQIEPEAEEVLVVRSREPAVDHAAARRLLALRERHRRDDAVQLHLALDRAVEMQVPAERVVVVADRDHRVDDEAACRAAPRRVRRARRCASTAGPRPPRAGRSRSQRRAGGRHDRRGGRRDSGSRPRSRTPARASSCRRRARTRRRRSTCATSAWRGARRRGRSSRRTRRGSRTGRPSKRTSCRTSPSCGSIARAQRPAAPLDLVARRR